MCKLGLLQSDNGVKLNRRNNNDARVSYDRSLLAATAFSTISIVAPLESHRGVAETVQIRSYSLYSKR